MIIFKYWLTVFKSYNCILSILFYKYVYETCGSCTNCATNVKNLLDSLGLSYIWHQQYVDNEKHFLHMINSRLQDIFRQKMAFFKFPPDVLFIST